MRHPLLAKWVALVSVFTFVEPLCFDLPRTRAHARLLGPCFKTGPMRPPKSLSLDVDGGRPHIRVHGASGTSVDEGDSLRLCWMAGDDRRRDGRGDSSLRVRIHLHARQSSVQWKGPAAWALIRTVSRTVELSFQSSFHLSLAVLVRYRSRARIEPWMESTTRLWAAIPNNPTLGRRSSGGATSGPRARGSHPLRRSLPRDSEGDGSAAIASLGLQLRHWVSDSNRGPVPASLAVTEGILVSFSSSA